MDARQWARQVARTTDLTDSALLLLYVLASHADPQGICWPSVNTLAEETRRTRKSVQRARAELVEKGILSVVCSTGRGRANLYILPLSTGAERASPERERASRVSRKGVTGDAPRTNEVPIEGDSMLNEQCCDGRGWRWRPQTGSYPCPICNPLGQVPYATNGHAL